MTGRKYECPPIDQHCTFPTEEMAEQHLQRLKTAPPSPGWPVWYFRNGRTIYSQMQIPIDRRQPGQDWSLATLQHMKNAGLYGHPTNPAPVATAAGPQHVLF